MDHLKLETTYIPHLRQQFATGSLVLFTGAGFSLEAKNLHGESLSSVAELTSKIWNLCYPNIPFERDTSLQDIYDDALRRNVNGLRDLLISSFNVNADLSPKWYEEILSMPWLRIYTLNIDNLIENVLETSKFNRDVQAISAMTDVQSKMVTTALNVIHLNGCLNDVPRNVTFGRSQYASRHREDEFYSLLRSDLITRSVVFIGSTLEEDLLWEYIVSRGGKGARSARELRPRSYLVIPHLNRAKEALLAEYNIVWLQYTGEQFYTEVISNLQDAKFSGLSELKGRLSEENPDASELTVLSSGFGSINRDSEFLLGQEPSWDDVRSGRVAVRKCFEDIINEINSISSSTTIDEFLVVTGTAGTGKSSALMQVAVELQASGRHIGWLDANNKLSRRNFIQSLGKLDGQSILIINDADIYGDALSSMVRAAHEKNSRLVVILEIRSSKVDSVIKPLELSGFRSREYAIPHLSDDDIESVLDVLDKNHRLGILKGKARSEQICAFNRSASRQLLVAMYEATSGKKFAERASDELEGLDRTAQIVYGLVCTASAYRFHLLRDEVLIALGDTSNESLNSINSLVKRKLIHSLSGNTSVLRSRHRVIANLVSESLIQTGAFERILRGLVVIGIAKTNSGTSKNSRNMRMLTTFLNHNFIKRAIDPVVGRNVYNEFEEPLAWNFHYWLHRGALELETNNLDYAENYLNQAASLRPDDIFVQTEIAYLYFKKAIASPCHSDSKTYVQEAIQSLSGIIVNNRNQSARASDIMCRQGLAWANVGLQSIEERRSFLTLLDRQIKEAVKLHSRDEMLMDLEKEVHAALLRLAVV